MPHPKLALSLTHDLLRVLLMDTWWNFGHEFKKRFAPFGGILGGVKHQPRFSPEMWDPRQDFMRYSLIRAFALELNLNLVCRRKKQEKLGTAGDSRST